MKDNNDTLKELEKLFEKKSTCTLFIIVAILAFIGFIYKAGYVFGEFLANIAK